mmetsp:Transcript_65418/g.80095  ORF Transcript_65418/g.80095 Transcript_65418/m.80095 type:complete len:85 (+) Transcript_65418:3-257(+)
MCVPVRITVPSMTRASLRNAVLMTNQDESNQNSSQNESRKSCQALRKTQLGIIQLWQAISGTQVQIHTSTKGKDQTDGTVINLG